MSADSTGRTRFVGFYTENFRNENLVLRYTCTRGFLLNKQNVHQNNKSNLVTIHNATFKLKQLSTKLFTNKIYTKNLFCTYKYVEYSYTILVVHICCNCYDYIHCSLHIKTKKLQHKSAMCSFSGLELTCGQV